MYMSINYPTISNVMSRKTTDIKRKKKVFSQEQ